MLFALPRHTARRQALLEFSLSVFAGSRIEEHSPRASVVTKEKQTTARVRVEAHGRTSLRVYDMLGREVKTLVNKHQNAGKYKVVFDGKDLVSGIYFYLLRSDKYLIVKKCVMLK